MFISDWWHNRSKNAKENFAIALNETGTLLMMAGAITWGAILHDNYFKFGFEIVDSSESLSSDGSSEWAWSLRNAAIFMTLPALGFFGLAFKSVAWLLGMGIVSPLYRKNITVIPHLLSNFFLAGGSIGLGHLMYHEFIENHVGDYQHHDGWNNVPVITMTSVSFTIGVSLRLFPYALFFSKKCAGERLELDSDDSGEEDVSMISYDRAGV